MSHLLFPQKLHKLLDDNRFEDIISWQPHGRSFKVHQQGDFMKKVYPIYFNNNKTVKYPSFQRQLSYYGFRRQELSGPDKGGYYHPYFLRGCFSLCTEQVYRYVESAQEANENALPCNDKCSRELTGGLKITSLRNKQGSNGPEPMFYLMSPLPSLPNHKKRKADKEEFNTRRSHYRDHMHPFMTTMGPDSPSFDPFRFDTNETYPRYGHKEWDYPSNTVEPCPLQRDGWKHEVSDCYSAPSLSYDHDGRQNYHDTSADLRHSPYEHRIMMENETTSSRNVKETRDASVSNGFYSHESHGTQFNDYDYTNYNNAAPIPPARSGNIPTGHLSFIPNRPSSFRGDEKREDQSNRNSNVSTFDDEIDSIEPVLEFSSCSSRSLNESHLTMIVPAGAARMSDPSLLAEEEDADIFGHRAIEEKELLDYARLCINRDSFDWDDKCISSSFSFSW